MLVVEDKPLHVNKAVLSLASPVFDKMFNGSFKEGTATEIPMPGKKYTEMVEFLSCVYPSSVTTVTPKNMDIVMSLADEYQVSFLKERCDTLIETMVRVLELTTSQFVHVMYVAGHYGLRRSMKTCAEMGQSKGLRHLRSMEEFEQVDPVIKYEIVSRRLQRYEDGCENMKFSLENLNVDDLIDCIDHDTPVLISICALCKREEDLEL